MNVGPRTCDGSSGKTQVSGSFPSFFALSSASKPSSLLRFFFVFSPLNLSFDERTFSEDIDVTISHTSHGYAIPRNPPIENTVRWYQNEVQSWLVLRLWCWKCPWWLA